MSSEEGDNYLAHLLKVEESKIIQDLANFQDVTLEINANNEWFFYLKKAPSHSTITYFQQKGWRCVEPKHSRDGGMCFFKRRTTRLFNCNTIAKWIFMSSFFNLCIVFVSLYVYQTFDYLLLSWL